ncbi:MAG: MarR family transcriptional regulator [Anaeroplasma sp.]
MKSNSISSLSIQSISKNDLISMNKSELILFVEKIAEIKEKNLSKLVNDFKTINLIIDDYFDEINFSDELYNMIVFDFISKYLYSINKEENKNHIFFEYYDKEFYHKLFNLLNQNGAMTQKDIARNLDVSTSNLANKLKEISSFDFIYKFHIPTNKKSQYYTLTKKYALIISKEKNRNKIRRNYHETFIDYNIKSLDSKNRRGENYE